MSKAFIKNRFKEASNAPQQTQHNAGQPKVPEEESFFASICIGIAGIVNKREYFYAFLGLALFFDLLLSIFIVKKVAYTEIDWIAYMQEVGGFLSGDYNYANLKGDTGPLVYPAGFVYIYSFLYSITDKGTNILLAQYIFVGLYLLLCALATVVLHKTNRVPTIAILAIFASKRIHSIFMLRCFNDGIAMIILFCAILLFIQDRWTLGCFAYSLAVSVKMNILLFAPGLLLLMYRRFGLIRSIPKLVVCVLVQIALGYPFLVTFPHEYIKGSFDLGRVFTYIWTVNLKFLPEEIFVSKSLAQGLLATQLLLLLLFFNRRESRHGGLFGVFKSGLTWNYSKPSNLDAFDIVSTLMVSNFIGIVCARSLHFQFYVWYFHSLPLLLFLTPFPHALKLIIMIVIERVWNTFPSTFYSSIMLQVVHVLILSGIWWNLPLHHKRTKTK